MALGRAIISTTVGAESLLYTDGSDIVIADEARVFADKVIMILKDPKLRMTLGKNAQQLVKDKYDNRKICTALLDFCKTQLN